MLKGGLLQVAIIFTDKSLPYLQDNINEWLINNFRNTAIEIQSIYFPSGGVAAIVYKLLDPTAQEQAIQEALKKRG